MEALAFCIQASFVKWPTGLVEVVLPAQVAGQLPRDILRVSAGELITQNATGILHLFRADGPVFIQTRVINEDRENVRLAFLELGQLVRRVAIAVLVDTRVRSEKSLVQPY